MLNHEYEWGVDMRGFSVSYAAAKYGNVELAEVILRVAKSAKNRSDNIMDRRDYSDGRTALMIAAESHNLPLVKLFVEEGALISHKTIYTRSSVLHRVLTKSNYIDIELRFRDKRDVKKIDETMREMAPYLVNHSSIEEMQQEDANGCSPLYHACASGYFEVAALMVARGRWILLVANARAAKLDSGPAIACLRYAHRTLQALGGDAEKKTCYRVERRQCKRPRVRFRWLKA